MHKVKRETMLGCVKYDDLHYVGTELLAIALSCNISLNQLLENLDDKKLTWLFNVAEASHQFPFEEDIKSLVKGFSLNLEKDIPLFMDCWNDTIILTILIKELFYETDITIPVLFRKVYSSKLASRCLDKDSGWSTMPTNELLVRSFTELDLEKFYSKDKLYT